MKALKGNKNIRTYNKETGAVDCTAPVFCVVSVVS